MWNQYHKPSGEYKVRNEVGLSKGKGKGNKTIVETSVQQPTPPKPEVVVITPPKPEVVVVKPETTTTQNQPLNITDAQLWLLLVTALLLFVLISKIKVSVSLGQ